MSVGYRLFGDLNVAAALRGEAKRLRFILGQMLDNLDLPFGKLSRKYADGSEVTVRKLVDGNEIVEITGTAAQAQEEEFLIETFFIMVYWGPSSKKFYRITRTSRRIHISELTTPITVTIKNAYTRTAPLILNDIGINRHVVNYGATRENWLKIGSHDNLARDWTDRFWYRRGLAGDWSDNVGFRYRQIKDFLANYSTTTAYFPKETAGVVAWTEVAHNLALDIEGPFNYSLEKNSDGIDRATSWNESVHELGYAPEDVVIGGRVYGTLTDYYDLFGSPYNLEHYAYGYDDCFIWPVITTAHLRRRPRIYAIRYQSETGEQTTAPILTDTLKYRETGGSLPNVQAVSHFPFAALYGQKIFHIRNQHELLFTPGTPTTTIRETLNQELKAGSKVLAQGNSTFSLDQTRIVTEDYNGMPWPVYSTIDLTVLLQADYNFIDLLAFSQYKDFLFCFIKKTYVSLQGSRIRHQYSKVDVDPSIPLQDTTVFTLTATKRVNYALIAPTRSLTIATFNQTISMSENEAGVISASQDGSGKRVHGISCQANPKVSVFSFTEEEFTGLGAEASDYYFWGPLNALYFPYFYPDWPANRWLDYLPVQRTLFGLGAWRLPYPFPLEDQNTSLAGAALWTNKKLVVGAIRQDVEGHGYFTYVENPGSVGQVKRTTS